MGKSTQGGAVGSDLGFPILLESSSTCRLDNWRHWELNHGPFHEKVTYLPPAAQGLKQNTHQIKVSNRKAMTFSKTIQIMKEAD